MPGPDDIPELLRQRVTRQRRKLKIVRVSLGVTMAVSVILFVFASQSASIAPTARNIMLVSDGSGFVLLDQQFDLSGQEGRPSGTFGIVRLQGEEVTRGNRYTGIAHSFVRISDNEVGAVTGGRFLRFDLSKPDFPASEPFNLALNDPKTEPAVLNLAGTLWMTWIHGTELRVRPLLEPGVSPRSVHKTASPATALECFSDADTIYALLTEANTGTLTLVSFIPRIEVVEAPPAGDVAEAPIPSDIAPAPAPARQTAIQTQLRTEVATEARGGTLMVLGSGAAATPVVAYARKDDSSRTWRMRAWSRKTSAWVDGTEPPKQSKASVEISSFISMIAHEDKLLAIYSDGTQVRMAHASVADDGGVAWEKPVEVPLTATRGVTTYAVWVGVMFVVLLVMASQAVWLMLNRERPVDRTIAELLEKRSKDGTKDGTKKKAEPKFLYASMFARALALLIDIAVVSPVVIVLQVVYEYTWEQAYGFLALMTLQPFDASILNVLRGTLVTLLILTMYGAICELVWGRTFGKTLLRLRVVDAKGEAPVGWRIAVRNLVKIVELIHWAALFIPMGCMMLTGKQQRLGDWLAGTFVIVDAVPEESPDDIDI